MGKKSKAQALSGIILMTCGCLHSLSISANDEIDQYLLGAVQQASLVLPEINSIAETAEPGWINSAEIRYSGSDMRDQSLAIRIQPKSSGERSAENGLIELRKMQVDLGYALAVNSALELRYQKLITVFRTLIDVNYYQNKKRASEEIIRVYRQFMHTEKFDFRSFQEANLTLEDSTRQHRLYENRLEQVIANLPQSDITWRRNSLERWLQQLVSVTEMQLTVNHHVENTTYLESSPDFRRRHLQWRIEQQKLKRERSEKNSWVKYVELKHASPDTGESETTLSFSIPFGGGHSQLLDREIAVSNANYSLQSTQQSFRLAVADLVSRLDWQAVQYHASETAIDQLNRYYSKLLASDQPLLLLNLKDKLLKENRLLELMQVEALQYYIELLSLTGKLSFWPLKNWLVHGAPEIGE